MEKIGEFLKQFGILLVALSVGIGVLIYGLWGEMSGEGASVEIIKEGSQSPERSVSQGLELGNIVVDIAGAVEKPGVYQLPSGSRIGDALVMAGGLAAKADRDWVAKNLNLAQELKDAEKVYIPSLGKETSSQSKGVSLDEKGKININTASLSELDSLSGIGEARAKLIMDNRPYGKTDDLVSKAKIPQSVYEKIKDLVSVY